VLQHRLTILGPHIDHAVYMSLKLVSPDLDLIFTVLTVKFTSSFHYFVSLLRHNLGSPYMVR